MFQPACWTKRLNLPGRTFLPLFYADIPFFLNDNLFNAGGIFTEVVNKNSQRFSELVGFHPKQDVKAMAIIFREKGTATFLLEVDYDYDSLLARLDEDLKTHQSIKGKSSISNLPVYQLNTVRGTHQFSLCPFKDGYLLFTAPGQMKSFLTEKDEPGLEVPWAFNEVDLKQTPLCGFLSFKKGLPPFIKNVPPMAMHMLSGLNRLFFLFSTTDLNIMLETSDLTQAQALAGMLNQMKNGLSMQIETSLKQLEQSLITMSPFRLIAIDTTVKVAGLKLASLAFGSLVINAHEAKSLMQFDLSYQGLEKALPTFLKSPSMLVTAGLFAVVAIPNFTKARTTALGKGCNTNLKILEGALEMYKMDRTEATPIPPGTIYPSSSLGSTLLKGEYITTIPTCKGNGIYNHLGNCRVSCSIHGALPAGQK